MMVKENNMKICDLDKRNERGFILVTSIILLAILMGLGAAAMFKTQVEIKVSASAMESAKAFAAAQAGLDYTYYYWSAAGNQEFKDIAEAASAGGTAGTNIMNDEWPTSVGALGATPALVDTWVRGAAAKRVYNLTSAGMLPTLKSNWNVDNYAQVAVWTTRFQPSATGYPYATHKNTADTCSDCTAVTYVLGRSGNAYKLLREYAFISTSTIQAFGAMMNAPKYNGDGDCSTNTLSTTVTTTTPADPTSPASDLWTTSHLIDATQAPGGIAMSSNNGINAFGSNKAWDSAYGTGTTLTTGSRAIDPFVVYDPGKVNSGNYPEIKGEFMSASWATTVRDSLFVPPKKPMNYFTNGNQLFPLDAYREAANRISGFAVETINGYTVTTTGTGLTSEVRALKTANAGFGRAGTLNWDEVYHNIQGSIPMYGLLRFMVPMEDTGSTTTVCGTNNVRVFDPGSSTLAVDPLADGLESPDGKLIVYGGALFDFFDDANGDAIYQPATESLLTREEATASGKVNVDNPLMFNPVMDGMIANTGLSGAADTCDVLNINCYPNGAPGSDAPANADGVMDLIWDVDYVARNWTSEVRAAGAGGAYGSITGGFRSWMNQESPAVITSTATDTLGSHAWSATDKTNMWNLLDYYIRTTSEASKNEWFNSTGATGTSASQIETDYASFYIDTGNDLIRPKDSAADLYHAFLPSGYIHGWKRGILMTGLANASPNDATKSIWNIDLIKDNSVADPSPSSADERSTFYITGVGANARIDQDFADVASEMYAGGLVDMHHAVNTSGVVYTPDMLELEQKDKGTQGTTNGNDGGSGGTQAALQYINGIVISGGGVYMKDATNGSNARTIISYDDTSIDNLPTNNATPELGRKYWQELK